MTFKQISQQARKISMQGWGIKKDNKQYNQNINSHGNVSYEVNY